MRDIDYFHERQESRREAAFDALVAHAVGRAPKHCKGCPNLDGEIEDGRFSAHSPAGYRNYGSVDAYPVCQLTNDQPEDEISRCPLARMVRKACCEDCTDAEYEREEASMIMICEDECRRCH